MDITMKSILEMARGGFLERTDYEMVKVVENIMDPNTKATAARTLTIKMTFKPDDSRANIATDFIVKSTLATTIPLTTTLYIAGANSTGEMQVVEMVPQIPGQLSVGGEEQPAPPVLRLMKTS